MNPSINWSSAKPPKAHRRKSMGEVPEQRAPAAFHRGSFFMASGRSNSVQEPTVKWRTKNNNNNSSSVAKTEGVVAQSSKSKDKLELQVPRMESRALVEESANVNASSLNTTPAKAISASTTANSYFFYEGFFKNAPSIDHNSHRENEERLLSSVLSLLQSP